MNSKLLFIALICLTLFNTQSAYADSAGMRCGNHLIHHGMHEGEVRILCGEPDSVSTYYYHIYRGPQHHGNHRDVQVTDLIYNLGPRKFMRLLRFEYGRLVHIERLGYGYQ